MLLPFQASFLVARGAALSAQARGAGRSKVISGRIDIILKVLMTLIETSSRPDSAVSPIARASNWTPVRTSVRAQVPPDSPVS